MVVSWSCRNFHLLLLLLIGHVKSSLSLPLSLSHSLSEVRAGFYQNKPEVRAGLYQHTNRRSEQVFTSTQTGGQSGSLPAHKPEVRAGLHQHTNRRTEGVFTSTQTGGQRGSFSEEWSVPVWRLGPAVPDGRFESRTRGSGDRPVCRRCLTDGSRGSGARVGSAGSTTSTAETFLVRLMERREGAGGWAGDESVRREREREREREVVCAVLCVCVCVCVYNRVCVCVCACVCV